MHLRLKSKVNNPPPQAGVEAVYGELNSFPRPPEKDSFQIEGATHHL